MFSLHRSFLSFLRPALFALAAALFITACDFSDDDDDVLIVDSDVVYADFTLDRDDYVLSADGLVASFESSDIDDDEERGDVEDALDVADGDGALVLLYADGSLLFDNGGGTWSGLPVTVAYEAINDDGLPYVDYTVTYSYSFDDRNLYFDVISSAQLDFDSLLPSQMDFRLVVAPADRLSGNRLDVRDYEAVRQVLGLPE